MSENREYTNLPPEQEATIDGLLSWGPFYRHLAEVEGREYLDEIIAEEDESVITEEQWIAQVKAAEENAASLNNESDYIDTVLDVSKKLGSIALFPAKTTLKAVKWGLNYGR